MLIKKYVLDILNIVINTIQDGPFRGCSRNRVEGGGGGGGWAKKSPPQKCPLPKICHTFSTMMKLGTVKPYLKKIQKM